MQSRSLNSTRNSAHSSALPTTGNSIQNQNLTAPAAMMERSTLSQVDQQQDERSIILLPSELDDIKDLYDEHAPLQTHGELQSLLSTVGIHLLDEDVVEVSNNNGFENHSLLTLEVFVWIMDELKRAHLDRLVDDIHEAFNALSGGTEAILADDFREVARDFKLTVDVEKLIEEADEDKSGEIEFDEFEQMINMIGEMITPQATPSQPALDALQGRSRGSSVHDRAMHHQSPSAYTLSLGRNTTMHHDRHHENPRGLNFVDLGAREADSLENSARGIENAHDASLRNLLGGQFGLAQSGDFGAESGSLLRGKTKADAVRHYEGGGSLSNSNSGENSMRQDHMVGGNGKGAAFTKAKLLRKPKNEIVLVDKTTGAKKVLKLPSVAPSKDPSRLYNSKAPQWTVNYSNFMKK